MTALAKALADYLALRRALGFMLTQTARELPRFLQFMQRRGAAFITTELALKWAQEAPEASSVTHADRLAMVRRFAAWRSASDPRTEIPPPRLLPRRYQRPSPYIYGDEEVAKIVSVAACLPSPKGLRGLTYSTVFGLLAVTGMRVGEAVALDRADVDLRTGVLNVRKGKRGKQRFVPIHATTQQALAQYAARRDAVFPNLKPPAFFVSERRRRVTAFSAWQNFVKVCRLVGLRPPAAEDGRGRGPRQHDLRHRFAVATLIDWYATGADVDREIPKLATYLGHEGPTEVYWYLQAVPRLLHLATKQRRRATPRGRP
jgi:integrase/recombinase XerD